MRPFAFVGKSRLEAANKQISKTVIEWIKSWCIEANIEQIVIEVYDGNQTPINRQIAFDNCLEVSTSKGKVWGQILDQEIINFLFGTYAAEIPLDHIAQELANKALNHLIDSILLDMGLEILTTQKKITFENPYDFGSSVIFLSITQANNTSINLLLDASLFNHALIQHQSLVTLHKRVEVLDDHHVLLTVSLDFAKLNVNDIHQVKIGDVIRGDGLLIQKFDLLLNKQIIASANIGKQDNNLAVKLTSR